MYAKLNSFQELDIVTAEMREIKAPSKSRLKQKRPINSIVVYKDWIYCASDMVEGSNFKVCIKNHRAGLFFFLVCIII